MHRLLLLAAVMTTAAPARAADEPAYDRKEDVIYGRKFGLALTMDVFTPRKNANGAGVIYCVSGGFFSDRRNIAVPFFREYLNRGYTVFAVVHGSQPKFTIPEVVEDMRRAVRFIRHEAKGYGVDPDRLGVTGGSAGGHLSLMLGVEAREGNPEAPDAIDRETARVRAVGCFFPASDFLNYGKPGEVALGTGTLTGFKAPFDFTEFDPAARSFKFVTDPEKRLAIGKQISPAYHVSERSAPTLIIHGDADKLVPIQQAELFIEKLRAAKVPCELVVKKGAAHGWPDLPKDVGTIADWFDKHLAGK